MTAPPTWHSEQSEASRSLYLPNHTEDAWLSLSKRKLPPDLATMPITRWERSEKWVIYWGPDKS